MDDNLRAEIDAAVEDHLAASRALLHAGRGYFGPQTLTAEKRAAWELAVARAARAAERIRQLEERVVGEPEARGYLRGRLVVSQAA